MSPWRMDSTWRSSVRAPCDLPVPCRVWVGARGAEMTLEREGEKLKVMTAEVGHRGRGDGRKELG